jgi:hypothetical protein
MPDVLSILMRALHIASVITLLGGVLYARLVQLPGLRQTPEPARGEIEARSAAAFRPAVFAAIAGLLLSGMYNLFANPGHSPRYHMLLGVKLLLALHIFAVAMLATQPKNPRRARLLTGAAISGLVIILISAYLRRIF